MIPAGRPPSLRGASPHTAAVGRAARLVTRLVLTLLLVCAAVFALTELLPGNAATVRAGARADPERLAALERAAGLDLPAPLRFAHWLGRLVTGDLGVSMTDGRAVAGLLAERLAATAWVAVPAWLVACGGGVVVALMLARRSGRRGERAGSAALAAISGVPEVVLVTVLVTVLSGQLGLLPPLSLIPSGGSPADRPEILVLPVLAIAVPSLAWSGRLLRGPAQDVLRRPFVRDAALRGLPAPVLLARHVVPHLTGTIAQLATVQAGAILAGTAVVEALLNYPGLGQLLAGAVAARDIPVVQGVAVLLAVLVLLALVAADALAGAVTRRAGAAW